MGLGFRDPRSLNGGLAGPLPSPTPGLGAGPPARLPRDGSGLGGTGEGPQEGAATSLVGL